MTDTKSSTLSGFHGRQFHGVMDFMYDVQAAGFDNEHDNSLVLKALWEKVDVMTKKIGKMDGHVYLDLSIAKDTAFDEVLVVKLSNPYHEDVTDEIRLIERNQHLAVLSNVLTEKVVTHSGDLPVQGVTVYWFEARKMFNAQERFNKKTGSVFRAVYKTLTPKDDDSSVRLRIVPSPTGWFVDYFKHGEKQVSLHFAFSK